MSLPSTFENEINILGREYAKAKPLDVLQFCANHFQRRLEAQRAEHILASAHSLPTNGDTASGKSHFPGSNPFGVSSAKAVELDRTRRMQRLSEDEEGDNPPTSPKAAKPPAMSRSRGPPPTALHNAPVFSGQFGSSGFNPGAHSADAGSTLPSNYNFSRRTSVSAESMNPQESNSENWAPPFHPKTPDQEARLKKAVAANFIFSHLDDEQTKQVLGALTEKVLPAKGITVIAQGDVGDYFYIVEKGNFEIFVNASGKLESGPDGMGKKVTAIGPGGSFGELALMYNAPRAATVVSTEPSTLWQLDRVTFRRILMDSAFQRRRMYETFLAEVPLLQSLTEYERSKIADALSIQKFPAGHTIIKEGDPGEVFFILESGSAEVYKQGTEAPLMSYKKGDYFGELALLNDQPRAASVISATEVKVATLGKEGFQRLLGNLEQIMRRNDPSKKSGSSK